MFDLVLRRPETSATANYILMKKIIGFLTSPRFLFFYIVLSLAVPNVALCFTEHMPERTNTVATAGTRLLSSSIASPFTIN